MKKIVLILLSAGFVLKGYTQNKDSLFIKQVSDYILLHGKSYDDLRVLTKQVGQRLSGSNAMYKAEQWGLKTMQEAGADNAWLQECMVPHWIRGGKDEAYAIQLIGKKAKKNLDVI